MEFPGKARLWAGRKARFGAARPYDCGGVTFVYCDRCDCGEPPLSASDCENVLPDGKSFLR